MDGNVMQTAPWKAGVAAEKITPGDSMWLAGWAARRQPAQGKAGELFCKALALEDSGSGRAVIVTLDVIGVSREFADAVAAKVMAASGLPRERLLFNASHTHTGPEVRPDKIPFFEIPPEFGAKIGPYLRGVQVLTTDVIIAALKNLRPASLCVRQSTVTFAQNRRAAGGPVEHAVPDSRSDGRWKALRLAVLFGYACHNLTLPPTFCKYHGDYAGLTQRKIEQEFPGATAMFLAGAGADQDPAPRGTMELAEQHAQLLALSVQQSLAVQGKGVGGSLRVAFEEVALEFQPVASREALSADLKSDDGPRRRKAEFLLEAMAERRALTPAYPCPIQVLRLGDELLLIALGGEPVAEYALKCRAEFAGPMVWVAGYSNDMFGYLPTKQVLAEGGYEGGRALLWSALPAPFTEATEETVMAGIRRLVKRVYG